MRSVDHQTGIDGPLARFLGIERRDVVIHRQLQPAATRRDDTHAARRRIDLDASGHGERLHELIHPFLVAGLDDHVKRVLAADDCLAQDLDAVLSHVRSAEVIEEHGSHLRVTRGAELGLVPVAHDE